MFEYDCNTISTFLVNDSRLNIIVFLCCFVLFFFLFRFVFYTANVTLLINIVSKHTCASDHHPYPETSPGRWLLRGLVIDVRYGQGNHTLVIAVIGGLDLREVEVATLGDEPVWVHLGEDVVFDGVCVPPVYCLFWEI